MSIAAVASVGVGRRVAVASAVVLAFVWLALHGDTQKVSERLDDQVAPLPGADVPCRLVGNEAHAHAASLEQLATARWERVPFALREAPRAALQMAEAEACYAAANDREGRLRSAAARRAYGAEVERRFARARLLLRVSLARPHAGRAVVHASPSSLTRASVPSDAQLQVATLLALLERAPPRAESYRHELTRLSLRFAAEASERRRSEENER